MDHPGHDHDHDHDDAHGHDDHGALGGGGGGEGDDFDPDPIYDSFPSGESIGFGPEQGFNEFRKLNDPELFTEEAREDPVIRAFLEAPFSVTYVQFKSSTREAEWAIHKPHRALAGELPDKGIVGQVDGFPGAENARIGTYVINHELTLAIRPIRVFIVEDGKQAGQMIYKGNGSKQPPFFGDGVTRSQE